MSKWRRLAASTTCGLDGEAWHCEQNPAAAYASCNVPQELTNDEIDQELGSDAEGSDAGRTHTRWRKPAVWQLVHDNVYTHRAPKEQDEDDIMICHCRPIFAGGVGCGPDCLNRVLNMECVPGYCPCGEQCSNQMFSRRQYARLDKRRAGAKGFGLFTEQGLSEGQFIIEYIGEVLEEEEYVRRKEFYQESGQRHYYFMNVGNGEVIDACRKGALGRFINHSCDPNCETQKWVVRGELAIGLFALRDIQAGEELTFDYNFERYGDKPMRCLCGARNCRGFIGGTGEGTVRLAAVEDPADCSADPEPIMVEEREAAADPLLLAVLEAEVGLAAHAWDANVRRRLTQLAVKRGIALEWASSASSGDNEPAPRASGAGDSSGESDDADERLSISSDDEPAAGTRGAPLSPERPGSANGVGSALGRAASQVALAMLRGGRGAALRRVASPRLANKGSVRRGVPDKAADLAGLRRVHIRLPAASSGTGWKRRSEVDRRLESLVGPAGRLRDTSTDAIVRMLRLFNLCDIGPASDDARRKGPGGTPFGSPPAAPTQTPAPALPSHAAALMGTAAGGQERDRDRNRERDRDRDRDRGRDRERRRDKEGDSRSRRRARDGDRDSDKRSRGDEARAEGGELTARQRARMADLSLLLDVVLKTSAGTVRREFCRCGLLHQLQAVLGRCLGPQYSPVLRKLLKCALRALALLKKFPLAGASAEVQAATAVAEHARGKRSGRGRSGEAGRMLAALPWGLDASGGRARLRFQPGHDGGRLGDMVAKHQALRKQMERLAPGEAMPLSPDPLLVTSLVSPYGGSLRGALPGLPSPARAPVAPAPGLAQALPPPPPAGRRWPPPLHRLHSSSALSALSGPPTLAAGAPVQPALQPPPLREAALAPESRKRSFQAAMEDGELPGLPPGFGGLQGTPRSRLGIGLRPGTAGSAGGGGRGAGLGGGEDSNDDLPSVDGDGGFSDGGNSGPAVPWEEAWDAPGPRFEDFVEDCVRRRLGKYRQPAHPMRLSAEEAMALYKKVRRVIVDTERKAYEERTRAAAPKPIERLKVEAKLKEYVRETAFVARLAPAKLFTFAEKLKKVWLRTLPTADFVGEDYLGNQYYEDREEAARSFSPKRGRFIVYAAVVQPPDRLLPSVNRADPGTQIPTEWYNWLHFTHEKPPVGPWKPVKPIYGLNRDPRLPVPDFAKKPKGWWSNPDKVCCSSN
ncbi:hypothetical protein WJX81_004380 [Elliptochloris bilobata]|uniref:Uncharacterized protein n=1 Tax=Elliptochloris bilobata TaxID=381761 RepID=A0AAW1SHN9_9CHLO